MNVARVLVFTATVLCNWCTTGLSEDGPPPWPPADVRLDDDPSRWLGHGEPLASRFPKRQIYDFKGFPAGEIFFGEYVVPKIPLVMKQAYQSAVLHKIPDETIAELPHAFVTFVDVKKIGSEKEETRRMSMRNFVNKFRREQLFLDIPIPTIMKSQFTLPRALQCEEVADILCSTRILFHSGNWNAPLQRNTQNAIHCLLDGTVSLKMVNYVDFEKSADVFDQENGTVSNVDVDRVDFTKYPSLREVPLYHTADLNPGDCFFVPAKWLFQFSSQGSRTVQARIFWTAKTVLPTKKSCSHTEPRTMVQSTFTDDPAEDIFSLFTLNTLANFIGRYMTYKKSQNETFDKFEEKLRKDKSLIKDIKWNDESHDIASELFANGDTNGDGILSFDDVDELNDEDLIHLGGKVEDRMADFKDILEDQEEEKKPKGILEVAKSINQDYEKELNKILEDGFNEILREVNIPGHLLFSKDGEPIIEMDDKDKMSATTADEKEQQNEKDQTESDDDEEEIIADDEDDEINAFREKLKRSERTHESLPKKDEL